jgi:hypothetical protein
MQPRLQLINICSNRGFHTQSTCARWGMATPPMSVVTKLIPLEVLLHRTPTSGAKSFLYLQLIAIVLKSQHVKNSTAVIIVWLFVSHQRLMIQVALFSFQGTIVRWQCMLVGLVPATAQLNDYLQVYREPQSLCVRQHYSSPFHVIFS